LNQNLSLSIKTGQSDITYKLEHNDPWTQASSQRIHRNFSVTNTKKSSHLTEHIYNSESKLIKKKQPKNVDCIHSCCDLGILEWIRPINPLWRTDWGLKLNNLKYDTNKEITKHKKFNNIYKKNIRSVDYNAHLIACTTYNNTYLGDKFYIKIDKTVKVPKFYCETLHELDSIKDYRINSKWDQEIKMGRFTLLTNLQSIINSYLPNNETSSTVDSNLYVRGYHKGDICTNGLCYIVSGELCRPISNQITGIAFADFGNNFGSKFGRKNRVWGMGCGIILKSPIGPLRMEYTLNDHHKGTFHFGLESDQK